MLKKEVKMLYSVFMVHHAPSTVFYFQRFLNKSAFPRCGSLPVSHHSVQALQDKEEPREGLCVRPQLSSPTAHLRNPDCTLAVADFTAVSPLPSCPSPWRSLPFHFSIRDRSEPPSVT